MNRILVGLRSLRELGPPYNMSRHPRVFRSSRRMQVQFGVDDRPPWWKLCLLGLQWSAVLIPSIITLGRAVAVQTDVGGSAQTGYVPRLFIVSAIALVAQVYAGHRLPVIAGPAAVLLVGVLASAGTSTAAVQTSMLLGGMLLAGLAASGLLRHVRSLFTDNVVAVVLLLIAFTLTPTILQLLLECDNGATASANLLFALVLVSAMFVAHRMLPGIWRSTVIVWSMLVGTAAYLALFPASRTPALAISPAGWSSVISGIGFTPRVEVGVLVSFLLCYLAVAINDLGSIQSMGRLLELPDLDRRLARGITVTGLANVLAGLLGVVGPVNYSLSPGVVMSSGCASRYTLLPTAAIVGLLPFVPSAMSLVSAIPSVVIGCVLLYVLAAQVAAGMLIVVERPTGGAFLFEDGLVVGLPVLLGTVIAFLPAEVLAALPAASRPLLGNGFVVGVIAAIVLQHVVLRPPQEHVGWAQRVSVA